MNSLKTYNIAIDASPLTDGNSARGVGFYTKNLVSALQSEVKSNPEYSDFHITLITDHRSPITDYSLIHYPFFDPFKPTLKQYSKIPTIVTVHDLIPIEFKSHFPVGLKGNFNWWIQRRQLLKTNFIITVSHYSKYSIHKLTNYPIDRIYTTYEAPSFTPPTFSQSHLNKIKVKYNLPKKFVLFVGDINWNKNIRTLVNACIVLSYPLVIVGKSAANFNTPLHPWTQDIHWLQEQSKKTSLIKLAGFIPDEDLPYFYKLATIYCQPSYAEGFGLSPVEAMACGCPVIYSQESSLWEVMDFNGIFFNPYSIDQLTESLRKLWGDTKLQLKYSQLGLKRASFFNWKYTATQTLAIYRLALFEGEKK